MVLIPTGPGIIDRLNKRSVEFNDIKKIGKVILSSGTIPVKLADIYLDT